jgi:hypothetical protein
LLLSGRVLEISFISISWLALDAPRFYILGGNSAGWIEFEEGIEIDDIMTLKEKGHRVLLDVVSGV